MTVAAAKGIDMALKGSAAARMMLSLGRTLLAWAGQLTAKLLSMYSSHLKPLLNKLLEAFLKHLPKKAAAVANKVTNKAKKGTQQLYQEVTSRFKGKIKPPPKCACAASPNSIGYVLGEESLQHTDFSLPGVLPIISPGNTAPTSTATTPAATWVRAGAWPTARASTSKAKR